MKMVFTEAFSALCLDAARRDTLNVVAHSEGEDDQQGEGRDGIAGHLGAEVLAAIRLASKRTGVEFSFLMELAATESSFNPQAKASTSTAVGLYQFKEDTWLDTIKVRLCELPLQKQRRFLADYQLGDYDASVLTSERATAQFFDDIVQAGADAKRVCNLLTQVGMKLANERACALTDLGLSVAALAKLAATHGTGAAIPCVAWGSPVSGSCSSPACRRAMRINTSCARRTERS